MSDSNLHQNTSEDQGVPSGAPATTGTAPAPENVPGEGEHKSKTFTRRSVLAMAGCGVAGLVVGGVLASWGVTSKSIASGRIEIRTTPTKMIVTDRARCSGCQRCEMACTLKNDGRVCQHIARVRVWPNYNFGASVDTKDGIYDNCEFTVEHCKQCADPACMNYCPVHAIYADEESGARTVDTKKCIGCYACRVACQRQNDLLPDESFIRLILGDTYVNMTIDNITSGKPMGVYNQGDEWEMFLRITTNNIRVSFIAFAFGLFFSAGTLWILFSNGMMIGAFEYFFYKYGLLAHSVMSVWAHGTFEITSVIIAGAAGLIMGNSFLFPGTYPRLFSFRRGAVRGVKIVAGLVPFFILAGVIESYITRYADAMPVVGALCIGISAVGVIGYFIVYPVIIGRRQKLNEGEID